MAESMAAIRQRRDEDVEECVALLHRVHDHEGYPRGTNDFRHFITYGMREAWVGELDTDIIGHIAVADAKPTDLAVSTWRRVRPGDSNIGLVERLYVHPNARRKGIAEALLEAAAAYGRANGTRLVLFVLVANQAALRLYQRAGWEEYGTGSFRFGENHEKEMHAICFASPRNST
ncbi:uncharacterized protein LTR77_006743 [Saxophila tyrrhenica]|uniref:N-acetyltransferase domain-containing protein n=1 Tax=Saxophila tyrrhenica TaxID=1690608 RepID=A0AAV9P8L5_9PEZI|nr:hypothetical protein LTR77_006743 [Saxophila tyrrhenica]